MRRLSKSLQPGVRASCTVAFGARVPLDGDTVVQLLLSPSVYLLKSLISPNYRRALPSLD